MKKFIAIALLLLILPACREELDRREVFIQKVEFVAGGWGSASRVVLTTEKSGVIILAFVCIRGNIVPLGKATIIRHNYFIEKRKTIEIVKGWKTRHDK